MFIVVQLSMQHIVAKYSNYLFCFSQNENQKNSIVVINVKHVFPKYSMLCFLLSFVKFRNPNHLDSIYYFLGSVYLWEQYVLITAWSMESGFLAIMVADQQNILF